MIAYLLLIPVVAVVVIAALQPKRQWSDDSDCRGIIWHTVRAPSAIERLTFWYSRYYLHLENPQ